MRSSANKLTLFKQRLRKTAVSLVTRLNKSTRILYKMFQIAQNNQKKSVFDKTYILHTLLNGQNWKE